MLFFSLCIFGMTNKRLHGYYFLTQIKQLIYCPYFKLIKETFLLVNRKSVLRLKIRRLTRWRRYCSRINFQNIDFCLETSQY